MKRHVARIYRRLPLPGRLQYWLIRRVTPTFLVGVAGVVLNKHGQILLLEHIFHTYYIWGLPGGWMGRGESPDQALQRELCEELALEIEIKSLLDVETHHNSRFLQIGYLCQARGKIGRLSSEILSARWVMPGDLPGPIPPFQEALIARALEQGWIAR